MSYNKMFKNWRQNYLVEARIDKIKKQYPGKDKIVDQLSDADPSGNDKYLLWMTKNVVKGQKSPVDVIQVVQSFDQNVQRLKKRDINQWKFDELKEELASLGTSKTQAKSKIKEGALKIHEDKNYIILAPLTSAASCVYGAGTKWCISAKEDNYFDQYTRGDKVTFVFVIDKNRDASDPYHKIALVFYADEHLKQMADNMPPEYKGMYLSPEQILGKIKENPQEIFSATDDLECQIKIPPRAAQHMQHQIMYDAPDCGDFLEQFFDNTWRSKYQKLVLTALGTTKEEMVKYVAEDQKEWEVILKECINLSYMIEPEAYRSAEEIAEISKFNNFTPVSVVGGYGKGWVVDIKHESPLLRRVGLQNFNGDGQFYLSNIKLIYNVDMRKLGIKYPEFTVFEQLALYSFYTDSRNPTKAGAWATKAIEEYKDKPEVLEALLEIAKRSNSNYSHRLAAQYGWTRTIPSFMSEISREVNNKDLYDATCYAYAEDKGGPTIGELGILLTANHPDNFLMDYKAAKVIDAKLPAIMQHVKELCLKVNDEAYDAEKIKQINPDRQNWFWELV